MVLLITYRLKDGEVRWPLALISDALKAGIFQRRRRKTCHSRETFGFKRKKIFIPMSLPSIMARLWKKPPSFLPSITVRLRSMLPPHMRVLLPPHVVLDLPPLVKDPLSSPRPRITSSIRVSPSTKYHRPDVPSSSGFVAIGSRLGVRDDKVKMIVASLRRREVDIYATLCLTFGRRRRNDE